MFDFVVRHLRWLARIPGFPQFFDSFLLVNTWLLRHSRFAAIETLEDEAMRLPGVRLKAHRFGGIEFQEQGRELCHVHGNGLLDVLLTRDGAKALLSEKRVRPHHVFPHSRWISFQMETTADVPFALELLKMARSNFTADTAAS